MTPGERTALDNLARKAAGEPVDWINIADARTLTEAGYAERDRQGWRITPQGAAALKGEAAPASPSAAVLDHHFTPSRPRRVV